MSGGNRGRRRAPWAVAAGLVVSLLGVELALVSTGSTNTTVSAGSTNTTVSAGSTNTTVSTGSTGAVGSTGSTNTTVSTGSTGAGRPDIVVITADDMRADDLRFMPAVRKLLGGKGLTYRNSFSPYPLCCPARSSFLTGQYAHNHDVLDNKRPFGFAALDDRRTLATSLEGAGYRTAFVGKYLNNYGIVPVPRTGKPSVRYVPDGWTDWYAGVQLDRNSQFTGGVYHYFKTVYNINGKVDPSYRGEYQTRTLGRFSRRLVRDYAADDAPFFLWLSSLAPHSGRPRESDDPRGIRRPSGKRFAPATPARPRSVWGAFDREVRRAAGVPRSGPIEKSVKDKPRGLRKAEPTASGLLGAREVTRQRAESLLVLDREVRRLVQTLRKSGRLDDTILVFTSDNGFLLGEHRHLAGKTLGWEPSVRVPLIIAGAGVPTGVRYEPATTMDLTSTILDLAGAAPPLTPDGRSLVPGFAADRGWVAPVVIEALVDDTRAPKAQAKRRGFTDARTAIGVRTPRWKLLRYATGEVELYDLERDPHELDSRAGDPAYAHILDDLLALWSQAKDCAGAACRLPLPASMQQEPPELAASTERQREAVRQRYGATF